MRSSSSAILKTWIPTVAVFRVEIKSAYAASPRSRTASHAQNWTLRFSLHTQFKTTFPAFQLQTSATYLRLRSLEQSTASTGTLQIGSMPWTSCKQRELLSFVFQAQPVLRRPLSTPSLTLAPRVHRSSRFSAFFFSAVARVRV